MSTHLSPKHSGRLGNRVRGAGVALALVCAFAGTASLRAAMPPQTKANRYWRLGVGCYFGGLGGLSELDVARFDWLYLGFGNISANRKTVDLLNRLLAINPRLKIVIRLWPIGGLGDCPQNRHQATFLHYLYAPGVKEKLLERIHEQTRLVLDHIDKPENVLGSTFLEELPLHFSAAPFRSNKTGPDVGWAMQRFRTEIEAERGEPLRWDDDTRRWWGRKWTQVMGEIHAAMKKASDGRLVFYYQQTNHGTLDMVPEGTPLSKRMLLPIRWEDIIQSGLADGFFAYPNNRRIWEQNYLRFATANDWPFFSQVSHPSGMRLCSWKECLALAKTRCPQNLGYFFYCSGSCAADRAWNADPGIPPGPKWNTRRVSMKLHIRRHLALEDVGMDIVRRQPPKGFGLDPAVSPPATLRLGHLQPGERRTANWWLSVPHDFDGAPAAPFVLTARAKDASPSVLRLREDTAIPICQPHEIGIPGTEWMEAAYRLSEPEVKPRIVIEALRGPVRNPAVGDGYGTLTWQGVLNAGMRLVLAPQEGVRLFIEPLVSDDAESRRDADDPTGYRAFEKGYLVIRLGARGKVDPEVPLRVKISGKAKGGGQSLVVLRFRTDDDTTDRSLLANRFSKEWRTVTGEVAPPEDAVALQNVFLYRFRKKGRVWYGPVTVQRADAQPEGRDVSDRLRGAWPALTRSAFRIYHYTDDGRPTVRPRVRVQLRLPRP